MKFLPLKELPIPESEPSIDWTFFSHFARQYQHYLIYACQRDFLSTPRSYSVLELSNNDGSFVNTNIFQFDDYFDLLQIQPPALSNGLYQINQNNNNHIFLFILDNQIIEIAADNIRPRNTIYHCLDSKTALLNLLQLD